MNICIIGWYGTETLGDRAILDGIIKSFGYKYQEIVFKIGSLYPFYTKRTLYEEKDTFLKSAPLAEFEVFEIKNVRERREVIRSCDVVLMGGGPLMDLVELYIIDDCFLYAKSKGIPTYIFGCGIGPLKNFEYINLVRRILKNSYRVCIRDEISIMYAKEILGENYKYELLGDPAIISIENYKREHTEFSRDDYLVVNFRNYPQQDYGGCNYFDRDEQIELLKMLLNHYSQIKLVPMHTFFMGGDDREYLAKIDMMIRNEKIEVIHNPLNLEQLYFCFANAKACIGMRYHSVVMQTILNGNNFILNYTDPQNGKIPGYIKELGNPSFYNSRVINMQQKQPKDIIERICEKLCLDEHFDYMYSNTEKAYREFVISNI